MHGEFSGLVKSAPKRWQNYRLWNHALCEHFFTGRFSDRPVYLDLDSDVLSRIARETFDSGVSPEHLLRQAVVETLDTDRYAPDGVLSTHLGFAEAWRRSRVESFPPFIGILGYFSHVAEQMVASEDFSSNEQG